MMEDDGVEGAVELAVVAAAEPVPDRLTARGWRGATPARRAKAASEWTRPRCDQLTISCAATIGPTADSVNSSGTSARTWPVISCSSSFASSVVASILRASERSASTIASSSGVRECERRKRLQRRTNCVIGSRRSSSRRCSGAVTITLRSWTRACRRASTALRRASSSTRNASCRSPERGSVSVSVASPVRAARIASRGSSLPRSRRSPRAWRPTSSTVSPRSPR
jgi:hypothetical protein